MWKPDRNLEAIITFFLTLVLSACSPPSSPTPASLLIKVIGVASATVEVTESKRSKRVFLGSVTGQAELAGLSPGRYQVDGRPENGVDPDPVEIQLEAGRRSEVAVRYPEQQATLTIRLIGIAQASVVVSREGEVVFSAKVNQSHVLHLPPGSYTVDGQPAGGADPPAVDVVLKANESKTATLDYSIPPPPPATGVRFLSPAAGATLDQPVLHVEVEVENPSQYQALHVALLRKGVLKVWPVASGQTRYTADIVLDPDSYNGSHTLLARVQKTGEAEWTDAAAQVLVIDVAWNSSAYIELADFPNEVVLEPGQSLQYSVTARSRNGFAGEARFSADPLPGIDVTVRPDRANFEVGESKTLTLTVAVDPSAASGVRQAVVRWRDSWELRTGYRDFAIKASRKPRPRFLQPSSPWYSFPVPLEADVQDDGVLKEVRLFVDGKLLARVSSPPYQADWNPGLLANGPHLLRAEAEDTLGFVGTIERTLDLAIPLGVRHTIALPSVPSSTPTAFAGAVYLAAGNQVVRLASPDASPDMLTLPAPVRKLLAWNGHLYGASDTGVYRLAPDLSNADPVWSGVSDFRALVVGSEPLAVFGNRLRALESGWEILLLEPPKAVAASSSLIFVGYASNLLERRILGSTLAPEVRSTPEEIIDLTVSGGALWQSAPDKLWRYPLEFNLLKSPDTFASADWVREGVTVETDVATDPQGEPRADRASRDPAAAAPFRIHQTVQLAEGSYAFGTYAKGDPSTSLTLQVVRVDDGTVLSSRGAVNLANTDPWSYLETLFQVPTGGAEVRVEIVLEDGADPALLSHARLWENPKIALNLCGAPNHFQLGGLFTDSGGCVFRLGQGKVLSTGVPLLPGIGLDGDRIYLAGTDGHLSAWAGTVQKAAERPLTEIPVGGFLVSGYLYLGYADGTLRILDPLP